MKKCYRIINAYHSDILSEWVSKLLNDGWLLFGKTFIFGDKICQVMIKNVSFKPQTNDSTTKSDVTTD